MILRDMKMACYAFLMIEQRMVYFAELRKG
jgi:hypothetical protein